MWAAQAATECSASERAGRGAGGIRQAECYARARSASPHQQGAVTTAPQRSMSSAASSSVKSVPLLPLFFSTRFTAFALLVARRRPRGTEEGRGSCERTKSGRSKSNIESLHHR